MNRPVFASLPFCTVFDISLFLLLSGNWEGLPKAFGFDIGLGYPFFEKASPIEATIRNVRKGLPKNIFGICCADQRPVDPKHFTMLAIAVVTKWNDVPLVAWVVNQLDVCAISCRWVVLRAIQSVTIAGC